MPLEYRSNSAVGDVSFNFGKAFGTVSHDILKYKLTNYELHKFTVKWIENWLSSWAQWVVISSMKAS